MWATLTTDPDGRICMESAYDPVFVAEFKRALPFHAREWIPHRKRWLIHAAYAGLLLQLLTQWPAYVQDDRGAQAPPAPSAGGAPLPPPAMPPDLKAAFDTMHLAYTAPLGAAEAQYRFWAKHTHSDVGGNTEHFLLVNDAIQVIRKYLNPQQEP